MFNHFPISSAALVFRSNCIKVAETVGLEIGKTSYATDVCSVDHCGHLSTLGFLTGLLGINIGSVPATEYKAAFAIFKRKDWM